jgi:hypothetical protein
MEIAAVAGGGSMFKVGASQSEVASRKRCVPQTSVAAPTSAQKDWKKRFSDTTPIATRAG